MRTWPSLLVGTLVATSLAAPTAAEEVVAGVTTAVTTTARGTPPISPPHVLQVGSDVVRYERLQTDDGGRLHLQFQDRTTLTVGPQSEVVLDEFVYDPEDGSGEIVLGAARGVLRFVGGALSRQGALGVTTPVAVVGIRGSSAILRVDDDGSTVVIHVTGESTVRARNVPDGSRRLTRSGFAVRIDSADTPPSLPFRVDRALLAETIRRLEGPGSQLADGRIDEIALPVQQIAVVNSQQPLERSARIEGGSAEPTEGTAVDTLVAQGIATQNAAAQDRAENQVRTEVGQEPPAPAILAGGRWFATESASFTLGWRGDGQAVYDRTFTDAEAADGWITFQLGADQLRVPFQAGTVQTFGAAGTQSPFPGSVSGTGYVNAGATAAYYLLDETGFPGEGQIVFGGTPTPVDVPLGGIRVYELNHDHVLDHTLPFTLPSDGTVSFGGDLANAGPSTLYQVPSGADARLGVAGVAFDGTGAGQRFVISGATLLVGDGNRTVDGAYRYYALTGDGRAVTSAGGMHSIPDGSGNHLFGADDVDVFVLDGVDYAAPDFATPMVATRHLDGDTTESAIYNVKHAVRRLDTVPAGVGAVRQDRTLEGYVAALAENVDGAFALGGLTGTTADVAVETQAATGTLALAFDLASVEPGTLDGYRVLFGGIGAGDPTSAFVDDARWIASEAGGSTIEDGGPVAATAESALAFTHALAGPAALPGGQAPCTCEYLQWGWWGASYANADPASPNRSVVVPLGTFVVGDLPNVDVPTIGTGTYQGHAIAHIVNDGDRYTASGAFQNVFDFATRTGQVTVSNLDTRTFAGQVAQTDATGRHYATDVGGLVDAGVTMHLRGSFFGGGGDLEAATAGRFDLSGANYQGSGTFAADRVGGGI